MEIELLIALGLDSFSENNGCFLLNPHKINFLQGGQQQPRFGQSSEPISLCCLLIVLEGRNPSVVFGIFLFGCLFGGKPPEPGTRRID